MPERVVQSQIVNLLRSIGAAVYVLGTTRRRDDHQGTMQTPGIPDLWTFLRPHAGAVCGCALWIEVKAKGGKLSPVQADFAACCKIAGIAHVVGGVDDVVAFLMRGGWLKAENVPHYRRPAPPSDGTLVP